MLKSAQRARLDEALILIKRSFRAAYILQDLAREGEKVMHELLYLPRSLGTYPGNQLQCAPTEYRCLCSIR